LNALGAKKSDPTVLGANITVILNYTDNYLQSGRKFMQKVTAKLPEIKLLGIKCRTNNLLEQDPNNAKIGATIQKFFQNSIAEKIPNRCNPHTTYCTYSEYDSDHNGNYTYFIGEEVTAFSATPEGMFELIIPAQGYVKFTNGPGVMPEVCINVWQKIWQMTAKEFGSARSYLADFEVYDSRAVDPNNTVLDVYVGVKK
jgi:predicted transcriptional regulator YdeE